MEAFELLKVVPEFIQTVPLHKAAVRFPSGADVNCGDVLTPSQVGYAPTVTWPYKKDKLYTLAFIDPDIPTRGEQKRAEARHWLIVNIPGNDLSAGDTYSAYVGAGPPPKTGMVGFSVSSPPV